MANFMIAGAYTSMTKSFPFKGMHKTQASPFVSIDIEYNPETTCIASLNMTPDRAAALWQYCQDNWDEKKVAIVHFDGFYADGQPIDPVVQAIIAL